jgi:SulP family sulfate permease
MTGIAVGVTMGALLFMHRMANEVAIEDSGGFVDDAPDSVEASPTGPVDRDVMVYRINGPLFFGAVAMTGSVLDRIGEHPGTFVLDCSRVPFVDSTGAATLEAFAGKLEKGGTRLVLACASPGVLRTLASHRLAMPRIGVAESVAKAVAAARSEAL